MATTYTSLGIFDKAKKSLEKTIKLAPYFSAAHRSLSRIKKYKKDDKHLFEMHKIYENQKIEDNQNWYEPRDIYANVTIADNVPAYYNLAGDNINTLNTMISQQPVLYGGTL